MAIARHPYLNTENCTTDWRQGQNPRDAIVPFTLLHKDEYEIITINSQYWMRKL